MSGDEAADVAGEAEERKGHKKDKKHKKEKKHKRHKERRRSGPQDKDVETLEVPDKGTELSVAPNGTLDPGSASTRFDSKPVAVQQQKSGTPESGEIDEVSLRDGDAEVNGLQAPATASQGTSEKRNNEHNTADSAEERASKRHKSSGSQGILSNGLHKTDAPRGPPETLAGSEHRSEKRPSDGHGSRERQSESERETGRSHHLSSHRPSSRPRDDLRARERRPTRSPERRGGSERHPSRARSRDRSVSLARDRRRADDRRRDLSRDRRYEDNGRRDASRDRRHDDDRRRREALRDESRRSHHQSRSGGERRDEVRREDRKSRRSQEQEDKEFAEKVIAKLEEEEVDEDALIEQRRQKRQKLLAKLQQEQEAAKSVAQPTATELGSPAAVPGLEGQTPLEPPFNQPSPATQQIEKQAAGQEVEPAKDAPAGAQSPPLEKQPSELSERGEQLADSDAEGEDVLDEGTEEGLFQQRKEPLPEHAEVEAALTPEQSSDERHKIQNQEKITKQQLDMFTTDNIEDMFGDEPVAGPSDAADAPKRGLLDNYDDSEGYYNFQVGEIMDDRYEVFATHGKGVFSTVLRARDRKPVDEKGRPMPTNAGPLPEVAIKVIRANDIMLKAGHTEVVILRKLAGADPVNKYHTIRLLRTFEYRSHLCLVFEPLESNLRQLTKKYGQGIGLRLDAVRSMAAQMLMALHLMRQCGVLHADIKPDNILINRGHNIVKVCDFGSAMFTGNNEVTPYLVSRFYRAPEIILGLHYDHPLDVWSIGCVIFELFTGRILFPGRTNNEMLKLMMDAKGPFPKKMLKKGEFSIQHFEDDPNMSFCQMEIDPLTKRPSKRLVPNPTVKRDFKALLSGQDGDSRQIANLVDLLEKMMHLDPEKRITAKEALRHPFIKDGRTAPKQRPL